MLLDRVEEIVWRFRDTQGDWRDEWTPSQPDLLPRAVEMRITRTGEPSVTLRFLVGPGPKKKGVAADGCVSEAGKRCGHVDGAVACRGYGGGRPCRPGAARGSGVWRTR